VSIYTCRKRIGVLTWQQHIEGQITQSIRKQGPKQKST